ncbi:CoA ester lyase, partial [Jatrophihabitans sp.]|uniref:HpcH/HpaI aldolase/citrate lyase family protein n=1 Tax=Jatrophihabitans sp. TaxID=1932789 RepID=UPI0030C75059|nr:citrate lyase [Jatrophihabitans sp.]
MTLTARAALPSGSAWLFCPADRPERFTKAMQRADVVVLDLEDAVAPDAKRAARAALIEHPLDPLRVLVRVNPADSPDFAADLEALGRTPYEWIMLPKTESPHDLRELSGRSVVALCETPIGVRELDAIAAVEAVHGVMWGSEDLAASLGAVGSRDDDGQLYDFARRVRTDVLLACAANEIAAIDSVFPDIANMASLVHEAQDAAAQGFIAKACIHPDQVAAVREAMHPTPAQIEWAARVVGVGSGSGVVAVAGHMVDAPVLRRAESILHRAGA